MHQKRVLLFIACICTFVAQGAQSNGLSHTDKFVIGALAGCATSVALEPLIYIKNRLQQGKDIMPDRKISIKSCSRFYRGLGVNAAGFVPIMAIQNALFPFIQEQLKNTTLEETQKKIIAATCAGVVSAVPCCPRELLVVQQQNNGGNFYSVTRNIIGTYGCKTLLTRGFIPVMLGNSCFAGFFFGVTPYFDQKIKLYTSNNAMQVFAPSMMAGLCSAILTAPISTVRTRMQADLGKNMLSIIREIYNGLPKSTKKGLPAFFAGSLPRMIGIPLTMCLEYNFRNYFTQIYSQRVQR